MPGDRLDELARVLARPMPRRRMMRLSLGVLAGAAVAPRLAFGQRPTDCQSYCSSGTPCPSDRPKCCCVDSSETANAWVVPIGGACYDPDELECCPVKRPDGSNSVIYCDSFLERCTGNACVCAYDCGAQCCTFDGECVNGACLLRCPPDWTSGLDFCCPPGMVSNNNGRNCFCLPEQRCGDQCCPAGFACRGDGKERFCFGPPDAEGYPNARRPYPWSSGPGFGLDAARGPLPKPTRAVRGTVSYDVALIAVADQGSAALAAWVAPERDRGFRARARAPKVAIEVAAPEPAQAAVTDLIVAAASANAQLLASGRARGKALAAIAKGDEKRARQHSRDSGRFAAVAAKGFEAVPAKSLAAATALRSAGVAEVRVTYSDLRAARERMDRDGLAPDVDAVLGGLGLTGRERARVPARLAAAKGESAVGGVLLAPLEDPAVAAEHRKLAGSLRAYARAVARRPLVTTSRRPQATRRREDAP